MIEKNEIIVMANGLTLNPDTVEKDYVLSWLLWGINNHDAFANSWLFKGGTCLKKCYFETFRFSEDLDYTIADSLHLSADFLREEFNKITDRIYDETGIEFFKEQFKFKILAKDKGRLSAQITIHYNGPLRRKQASTARFASIKLDLTDNEIIVLKPQKMKVHHPYSDEPTSGIMANCYAFEEVVAEKIRALGERARPRDLYDVVHFFRNRGMIENTQLVYNVLTKKCGYKNISIPTFASIQNHEKLDELDAHNRVCIEIEYDKKIRMIEPLTFRHAKSGNKLFYGYEQGGSHPKSFTISRIMAATITNVPYTEKQYPIEINASGHVVMPPVRRQRRRLITA